MIEHALTDSARLEFALSMMVHQIFVPLFIGLMLVTAIFETLYVTKSNAEYKSAAQFIGKLCLPIVFVLIITGILTPPMPEDWQQLDIFINSVFSEYVGLLGTIVSTGMMLWLTAVSLFYVGWRYLPAKVHLFITWLLPFICAYTELPVIVLNGWMHDPSSAMQFDINTMTYQASSLLEIVSTPMASTRFAHMFTGAFLIGGVTLISLSCYYLQKNRQQAFAQTGVVIGASIGLCFSLFAIFSGDIHGRDVHQAQPMKLAQLEALWKTQQDGADLVLFALPDQQAEENRFEVKIPKVLGWMLSGTDDTQPVKGIKQLRAENMQRIRNGLLAHQAIAAYSSSSNKQAKRELIQAHQQDLGYAELVRKYNPDLIEVTEEQIRLAANDTVNNVCLLFFSFRVMVGAGIFILLLSSYWIYLAIKGRVNSVSTRLLKLSTYALPIPFIAYLSGWLLSEYGRQPWVIYGVMPTLQGAGSFATGQTNGFQLPTLLMSYAALFLILGVILARWIKQGPKPAISVEKVCLQAGAIQTDALEAEPAKTASTTATLTNIKPESL
ncbi:cytochrome ubiquinol oxidase subunit I [Shewanella pealeana]|uniref:Cytochrome bd ubiquinol oxidase subunit I n=1 Tax=Shewanella pealeana (strain ATCC 700345 / ANG-SQ1) TaxID=398579 RepID=A8H1K9_SHEPA|nr:cytochrome ubiquinol oxidase subunit I [Shewanella pealeana]ABV86446.1 cytochrome bd ubiquinol oxidase subunit I [Shewanella pealeana ATCC 700345]